MHPSTTRGVLLGHNRYPLSPAGGKQEDRQGKGWGNRGSFLEVRPSRVRAEMTWMLAASHLAAKLIITDTPPWQPIDRDGRDAFILSFYRRATITPWLKAICLWDAS